jgi:TatD DNase family protein
VSPSGEAPPAPDPLTGPVVDSHCHLDLVGGDVAEVLAAARQAGVVRAVTVGIDVATSRWSADAARDHEGLYAAVAIHPNEAHRADEAAWAEIERLAGRAEVVAVGETGLDYYRTTAPRPAQQESFRRHIAIAKATGKALVIHDRDAHEEVLVVLDEEGAPEHTVFHCFSGDAGFARRCVDRGYVLSFAGTLTFTNAPYLREAAKVAPAGRVLVETDAPFLAPMPYRGRPNSPYLVPLTLRALAAAQGRDAEETAADVWQTACRVFGLPEQS